MLPGEWECLRQARDLVVKNHQHESETVFLNISITAGLEAGLGRDVGVQAVETQRLEKSCVFKAFMM